jgi:hypothetical protein
MAGPEEGASSEGHLGIDLPPPPPIQPPEVRTVAALWSGIIATAMAMPALVQSNSWSISPEDPGPSGWPIPLWCVSFFIGLTSMLLASSARDRERSRGSQAGQKLAKLAFRLDILGACVWGVPFVVMISRGL